MRPQVSTVSWVCTVSDVSLLYSWSTPRAKWSVPAVPCSVHCRYTAAYAVYLQYRLLIHCWHTADCSVHCAHTACTLYILSLTIIKLPGLQVHCKYTAGTLLLHCKYTAGTLHSAVYTANTRQNGLLCQHFCTLHIHCQQVSVYLQCTCSLHCSYTACTLHFGLGKLHTLFGFTKKTYVWCPPCTSYHVFIIPSKIDGKLTGEGGAVVCQDGMGNPKVWIRLRYLHYPLQRVTFSCLNNRKLFYFLLR